MLSRTKMMNNNSSHCPSKYTAYCTINMSSLSHKCLTHYGHINTYLHAYIHTDTHTSYTQIIYILAHTHSVICFKNLLSCQVGTPGKKIILILCSIDQIL